MCLSVWTWGRTFYPDFVQVMHQVRAARKKLLQFSPALLLPTLPNFAHFAHLRPDKLSKPVPHREDGGDSKSKTLLFNSDQAGRQDPFYHIHHAEHCCRCGMLRFYQGWLCCRCPGRHSNLAGVYCCPIEGILTWEKHSQAFQEDKGKSQLAIWVTWLDGFRPAFFLLSLNCRDGNSCLPAVDFTKTRVWLS